MFRVFLILLAIFLILFAIFNVTNIVVEWGRPMMGFAALAAGVLAGLCAARSYPPPSRPNNQW